MCRADKPAFAPHAGRGLKRILLTLQIIWPCSFAPHAGRGLKHSPCLFVRDESHFRPARGARIETACTAARWQQRTTFAPHAGRGLKLRGNATAFLTASFAPHAGRGLKQAE